jgi:hypothetical protein
MYISLNTGQIWQVQGEFPPASLFRALEKLLMPRDVLVIGTYNPSDEAFDWLLKNDKKSKYMRHPVKDVFDINRHTYPRGQAFFLPANQNTFCGIEQLLHLENGSLDKALFFDHIASYRPTLPIVPLVNFHDAFNGGWLTLSGLYAEIELKGFVAELGVSPVLVDNPEFFS